MVNPTLVKKLWEHDVSIMRKERLLPFEIKAEPKYISGDQIVEKEDLRFILPKGYDPLRILEVILKYSNLSLNSFHLKAEEDLRNVDRNTQIKLSRNLRDAHIEGNPYRNDDDNLAKTKPNINILTTKLPFKIYGDYWWNRRVEDRELKDLGIILGFLNEGYCGRINFDLGSLCKNEGEGITFKTKIKLKANKNLEWFIPEWQKKVIRDLNKDGDCYVIPRGMEDTTFYLERLRN